MGMLEMRTYHDAAQFNRECLAGSRVVVKDFPSEGDFCKTCTTSEATTNNWTHEPQVQVLGLASAVPFKFITFFN